MSKALLKKLPKDRPFSEVEAAFSLQVAHDCKQEVSVAGLAARWAWSRGRVKRFIVEMGGAVSYQKDTSNLQNQRGQIVIQITDRYRADTEQIRLFENNHLSHNASRYRADTEQIASRSGSTINNPNPNKKELAEKRPKQTPVNGEAFDSFWSIYPLKVKKQEALKAWAKIKPDNKLVEKILSAVTIQKQTKEWNKEDGKYIPHPTTWLNGGRWDDEIKEEDAWQ